MTIKLTNAERIKVLNADDLFGIMQRILLREEKIDQNREHCWVVALENNNRILNIELISIGSINKTIVEPMEVYSLAVTKRAAQIILVHNHPSGDLEPSEADKDVTDRMFQVGRILNTPLVDHMIISTKSYISFKQTGLLAELARSLKYVPPYKLEAEGRKVGFEKGIQERNKQIAKTLKAKGVDIEFIVEVTGLSVAEIKRIRVSKKK